MVVWLKLSRRAQQRSRRARINLIHRLGEDRTMNMNLIALGVVALLFAGHVVAQEIPTEADLKRAEQRKPNYSPYPDQHFPNRVFWGDTHHHSNFSFDDGLMGTKLSPEESVR
jgi:hypothetical protein